MIDLGDIDVPVSEGVQAVPNGSAWVPAKGRYMCRCSAPSVIMNWEIYNSGDSTWYDLIPDVEVSINDKPPWLVTDGANARFISSGLSGTSYLTY